ncbi:MAG: TlpA family protein disulfide reductase, partial [Planctomycetales bacterium]|nr:TlpA family protein disulfide reductase [Planctomycetales bacterium]
ELVNFLLDMSEKPKSIRYREGFAAAVVDAADRLLAAETKEKYQVIAAEAKFDILHRDACLGDEAADKALNEFVDRMKDDSREKIARQVKFFLEERQAIAAESLPADQIPGALEELKGRITEQSLSARHLRMASAIVAAINQLEDGDQREKLFAEFGGLFAKSDDKQLARYGKKLSKPMGAAEEDKLVGQKLELDGITALNQPFDWASYRGKVVLVDFWATWCGPCRREMPHVRELHQKLKERGFDVVGVNLDQDEEALARYLEDNDAPWVNLVGERSQELAQQYGVRGIPTMILVDQNGTIVATSHQVGTLVEKAEKLLTNPPAADGAKDAEQPKAN